MRADAAALASNFALCTKVGEDFSRGTGQKVVSLRPLDHFSLSCGSEQPKTNPLLVDNAGFWHRQLQQMPPAHREQIGLLLKHGAPMYISNGWMNNNPAKKGDGQWHGIMLESSPLKTRHMVLSEMSGLPQRHIRPDVGFSLGELHTFIHAHERAHGLNSAYFNHVADGAGEPGPLHGFLDELKNHPIPADHQNMNDQQKLALDYRLYVDENLADVTAALYTMQQTGSSTLIKRVRDAREVGFLSGRAGNAYCTHRALTQVLENEESLKVELTDKTPGQLHVMARQCVADNLMDMETFNRTNEVRQLAKTQRQGGEEEKTTPPQPYAQATIESMNRSLGQAMLRLEGSRSPYSGVHHKPTHEEYARQYGVEVMASMRYASEQHPEFASLEGQGHLLKLHQRQLEASGYPEDSVERQTITQLQDAHQHELEVTRIREHAPHHPQKMHQPDLV